MQTQEAVVKPVHKVIYVPLCAAGYLAIPIASVVLLLEEPLRLGVQATPWVSFAAIVFRVLGLIAVLVLLYKMWGCIPRGFRRTSPGAAVGLLFVPIYNIYWVFQAWWGWTKDFNRFARSRYLRVQPMPEEIALLACLMSFVPIPVALLALALQAPGLSTILEALAGLVEVALTTYLLWRACDGINAVARLSSQAPTGRPAF